MHRGFNALGAFDLIYEIYLFRGFWPNMNVQTSTSQVMIILETQKTVKIFPTRKNLLLRMPITELITSPLQRNITLVCSELQKRANRADQLVLIFSGRC